jgi:succinate dehydrogenase/fumarate reductase flavoprotein subunit
MSSTECSRRKFVAGGALGGAAAVAMGMASVACADEAAAENGLQTKMSATILIVGGGLAGFSAGIHALELGAGNVLIIDKASGEGGDWAGSSYVCGGSYLAPVDDSDQAAADYAAAVYKFGQEHGKMELIETLANGSHAGLEWLKGLGVEYADPTSVFPAYPEVLTSVADMPSCMEVLRDAYLELGGTIAYGVRAVSLNLGADGIAGVVAQDENGLFDISAKKTLLCTGGYPANKQFLEDHIGENGASVMCRARSNATGDGIYMAQAVGGVTTGSVGLKSIHLSAVDPVAVAKGQPGNDIPYFLAINSNGQRFVDEALGSVRHGQAVFGLDVPRDGLICDSKVVDNIQATLDKLHGQGVETWQTDTLEEMAEIFGCPADALVATVDEFNAHVQDDGTTQGLSPDKSAKALTVDTPPYYGIYPLVPGCSLTYGGLAIDTSSHVLRADGSAIPNLFAAGEGTGGFFYDNYFGGTCLCRAVVYGRIAAETALNELA